VRVAPPCRKSSQTAGNVDAQTSRPSIYIHEHWCTTACCSSTGRISLLASVDEQDADAEFAGILQALVNRDRLEFLG
jgi:tRNA(Phe) wybutosine-synthesizing methylase Tyw3